MWSNLPMRRKSHPASSSQLHSLSLIKLFWIGVAACRKWVPAPALWTVTAHVKRGIFYSKTALRLSMVELDMTVRSRYNLTVNVGLGRIQTSFPRYTSASGRVQNFTFRFCIEAPQSTHCTCKSVEEIDVRVRLHSKDTAVRMLSFLQLPTGWGQVHQTELWLVTVGSRFWLCCVAGRVWLGHGRIGPWSCLDLKHYACVMSSQTTWKAVLDYRFGLG